jgi:hypothetical protein
LNNFILFHTETLLTGIDLSKRFGNLSVHGKSWAWERATNDGSILVSHIQKWLNIDGHNGDTMRLTGERKYEFSRAGVEQQTLFSDSSVTTGCITIFYSLSLLRIRAGVEFKNQGLHFRAIICKCGICPQ